MSKAEKTKIKFRVHKKSYKNHEPQYTLDYYHPELDNYVFVKKSDVDHKRYPIDSIIGSRPATFGNIEGAKTAAAKHAQSIYVKVSEEIAEEFEL